MNISFPSIWAHSLFFIAAFCSISLAQNEEMPPDTAREGSWGVITVSQYRQESPVSVEERSVDKPDKIRETYNDEYKTGFNEFV